MSRSQNVQLMRPALLAPLLSELRRRKLDASGLLARMNLSRMDITDNTGMATAKQVHNFVGQASDLSGDPYFCWQAGLNTDIGMYLLSAEPASKAATLGELLTFLSLSASDLASATQFGLYIEGAHAKFSSQRLYHSGPVPHTDAFGAGLMVALLKYYLGKHWSGVEFSLELPNPEYIPPDAGCRVVATGNPDESVFRFPTHWLLLKRGQKHSPRPLTEPKPDQTDLIDFLKVALKDHLGKPGLTSREAAKICDSSLREINGGLEAHGLTLAQLINNWRREKACQLLNESETEIAEIGTLVGYPDATSFSRVFRRWTGMSPRVYRSTST